MRFEIRLTENCNYNCSYCKDMHGNNKQVAIDYQGYNELINNFDNVEIFLYGGEPTLYYDINNIVDFFNSYSNISSIIIQTNGSNPSIINKLIKYNKVKINYSYHSENITLKNFISNICNVNKVNEIAYMDDGSNYKDYFILKKIYKKVEFCPILSSKLTGKSSTPLLKDLKNKEIFKEIQNDYHFKKLKSGKSNYDYWYDNINNNKDKECFINNEVIHIQDNKIYICLNSLIENNNGMNLNEYKNRQIICPYNICYFDMEYWKENYDKV